MEQHYFVTYIPLPTNIEDGGAVEQWIERMNFISDDLTWLLQQNHTKFWCEVRKHIHFFLLHLVINCRLHLIKIFILCLILIYDMHHGKSFFEDFISLK